MAKAKMIKYTPNPKGIKYFDNYIYECIDCGSTFTRHQYNDRINPYCGECKRKHQKERDDENRKKRQLEHDMQIRAAAFDEVKQLITERLRRSCEYNNCDECGNCCESDALLWLDDKLKEQKNEM